MLRAARGTALLLLCSRLPSCARGDAALPWLSVRPVDRAASPNATRAFVIADEWGREVHLHGVCLEGEERSFPPWQRPIDPALYAGGACPDNFAQYGEPPICGVDAGKGRYNASTAEDGRNDLAQIRALGLNVIRLCLSWSDLEPTPGTYSALYIARVGQIVGWAREQGVYVILDLHEDLYSLFIQPDNTTGPGVPGVLVPGGGQDGAPAWAVDAEGWPALSPFGIGDLNLKVSKAFQSFYENAVVPGLPQGSAPGPGLQDHYIGALAALLSPFLNDSTVAGVELMNEPLLGLQLDPLLQARTLYAFYRRAVQALTGGRDGLPSCTVGAPGNASGLTCAYPDLGLRDTRHLIFAEPSALRNTLDFSPMLPARWTNYTNIVHTPHVYTHIFTADQEIPWLFPNKTLPNPAGGGNVSTWSYPPSWDLAYTSGNAEASAMHSALFVTEFGAGMHEDAYLVEPTMDAAERSLTTGWTLWSFKSNCGWGAQACATEAWTVYTPAPQNGYPLPSPPSSAIPQNGPLGVDRERIVGRTMVRGGVGELLAFHFNTSSVGEGSSTPPLPPVSGGGRTFWAFLNVSHAQWEGVVARGGSGGEGWDSLLPPPCRAGGGPRHCTVTVGDLATSAGDGVTLPALLSALTANGSVTEVYIPSSVPSSFVLTAMGNTAATRNVVTWPDGSRSVYVNLTGPGLYGVTVGPPSACDGVTVGPTSPCGEDGGRGWHVDGLDACPALRGESRGGGLEGLLRRLQALQVERGAQADVAVLDRVRAERGGVGVEALAPQDVLAAYVGVLKRVGALVQSMGLPTARRQDVEVE